MVQIIEENFNGTIDIYRNDKIDISQVNEYDGIILSPGPGIPNEAGDLKKIIKEYAPTKKIFGVCLGLQAIAEVFGAKLQNLDSVYHGVSTKMILAENKDVIFKGIPDEFDAGRYHSWVVDAKSIPTDLMVTCVDEKGEIMALRHMEYDVCGVQFHPESVMTHYGKQMIINFLNS